MKIVCTDSTDPNNVIETASPKNYKDEAEACAVRDALREEHAAKQFLWFEVMPDDYVVTAQKPGTPASVVQDVTLTPPTSPASAPIGNEPDGTPQ